jgi:hypothetical protein
VRRYLRPLPTESTGNWKGLQIPGIRKKIQDKYAEYPIHTKASIAGNCTVVEYNGRVLREISIAQHHIHAATSLPTCGVTDQEISERFRNVVHQQKKLTTGQQ